MRKPFGSGFFALLASLASLAPSARADTQPPTINVLFPEAESVIETSRPVVAFSVFDAEDEVDPRATRIYLDGQDVSLYARNAGELVTFMPFADLTDGIHRIAVVVGDTKGNVAPPKLWSFTVKATTPPLVQLAGSAVTEFWYADVIKFPILPETVFAEQRAQLPQGFAAVSTGAVAHGLTVRPG
jgi:hypothetical protein